MSDNKNTTSAGSVLAAFTIGALAGAGIALLYAPCSGKETRRMLTRRARALTQQAEDAVDDAKAAVRGKKKQFITALQAGKDAIREEFAK